ncbi:ABC transporter substrate-binding protein [Paenibacillus sp. HB172176]|uniref:ABC transporter substrate-binding protein n=1 Tax=Paenibacillus sp. HB172176 TaxID=2493690 RepID=UPI001439FB75|nr:ABC transporter substrate-binding protein [Paenibacillus sp. HB172176]
MTKTRSRRSKIGVWALAVFVVLGLVLAGCSSNQDSSNEPSSSSAATTLSETPATSNEPQGQDKETLEPVNLIWYIRQAEPANLDSVMAKFNEMVKDKINATVEFRFVNPADYDSKMQLAMSSGEAYDLAYTANWTNNYQNNVAKGAYLALDDYLDKFPNLTSLFKPGIWDAVRVGGKIYGVPNKQIMNNTPGHWFLTEYVDKYNLDVTHLNKIEDLTPIFETIKTNEPDIYPMRQGEFNTYKEFTPLVVDMGGEYIHVDPKTLKVIDESQELMHYYKVMREWNQSGYFPPDVATLKNQNELIAAGKLFANYSRQKPGADAEYKTNYGRDFTFVTAGESVITQGSVQSTLTAVSAASEHPERALMLLDLLNTDKDIYNTLVFGLEGQDYTKVSDNRIEPIKGGYYVTNWMVGNVFNSYLLPGQADDVWEQTEAMDEAATIDPLIGFTFDREPVQNEIARCIAAAKEFIPILKNGLDDPDKTYQAYQEKLKASGIDKIKAEVERQLADWKAAQ